MEAEDGHVFEDDYEAAAARNRAVRQTSFEAVDGRRRSEVGAFRWRRRGPPPKLGRGVSGTARRAHGRPNVEPDPRLNKAPSPRPSRDLRPLHQNASCK